MRTTKLIWRTTGAVLIGTFGLRAGAQQGDVGGVKVSPTAPAATGQSSPSSLLSSQSSKLRVLDRPVVGPVVTVAKRTDEAPQLAPAESAATPAAAAGAAMSVKSDKVYHIASVKTRPAIRAIDPAKRLETVIDRYPDGKVHVERQVALDAKGNYVNAGTYTQYDLDGQVIKSGQFHNGTLNGHWMQQLAQNDGLLFSPSQDGEFHGPFISEATFIDGKLDGAWTIKGAKGQKIVQWTFERGLRSGPSIWWHANGTKRLEARYKAGALDGLMQEWDRDGKLVNHETYFDGKRLVKTVGWYTLGQKHYEGNFLRDANMQEPKYDWWHSKVVTIAPAAAAPDQQHGPWTTWYRNGNKENEAQYDHGIRVGTFKWYHENGQLQAQGNYEGGKKIGVWTTWHANGLKESVAEYRNDRMIGQWVRWDAEGKRIDTAASTAPASEQREQAGAPQSRQREQVIANRGLSPAARVE
jgi:antitoxin component YwqK of YwqJK toxin-antitoxin module